MYYTRLLIYCVDNLPTVDFLGPADLPDISVDVRFFQDRDAAITFGEREMDYLRHNKYERKNSNVEFDYQETDESADDYYVRTMTVLDRHRSELKGLYGFVEFRVGKVEMEDE